VGETLLKLVRDESEVKLFEQDFDNFFCEKANEEDLYTSPKFRINQSASKVKKGIRF